MTFDVLNAILKIAKPFSEINLEQVAQQIFKISSEMGGETNLLCGVVCVCVVSGVGCVPI